MPLESSPESPVPVRTVARLIGQWVARLGQVWVEGQVTQLTRRPGQATAFLVLRDPAAEMSLQVSCAARLLEELTPTVTEGSRIVILGRPEYWAVRGTLRFAASDIRPVGVGALLARLEQLRQQLTAEGLFAPDRKRPLPFLPRQVGLITGRASAAERDVVENARRRWPGVSFRLEPVAVQGPYAVTEVIGALRRLDGDPEIDVIVIARGGGSMEDLLPFSDESLIRAVAAASTPVVSAVGHETDTPLLDHVSDRRASTPTDAAKSLVPDMAEELASVRALRERAHRCVAGRLVTEQHRIDALRSRPVLADPYAVVEGWREQVVAAQERARRAALACVTHAATDTARLAARVQALSPKATLARGYAVLQRADRSVVTAPDSVAVDDAVTARLAEGGLDLLVTAIR